MVRAQLGCANGVCICSQDSAALAWHGDGSNAGFGDSRLSCERSWLGSTCLCCPAGPTKGRSRDLAAVPVSTSPVQSAEESKPGTTRQ